MVKAPKALLLDPELSVSAKLLWLLMQTLDPKADPPTPPMLGALTGLTAKTVRHGLAQLSNLPPMPKTPAATLPEDLLSSTDHRPQAKLLYGILQLTPGFSYPRGQTTYADLSGMTGLSPRPTREAFAALVQAGWLQFTQAGRKAPLTFKLLHPATTRGDVLYRNAFHRLTKRRYPGEAIMREFLTLLIDCDQFQDDATPGFLVNPVTRERLGLDRYYPELKVAFEFQGAQHFGETEKVSDEESRVQQARDLIKIGLCVRQGITLAEVLPRELTFKGLQKKVSALPVPLRDLSGHSRLIRFLSERASRYRSKIPD